MRQHHWWSRVQYLIVMVIWSGGSVAAQDPAHEHGGRPRRLGRVHFPTSCAATTQSTFDDGVALLHSFWFSAAIEAFEAVLARDPHCVMAHWGIAMSWWGNPFASSRSPQALEAGRATLAAASRSTEGVRAAGRPAVTERERAYLTAVGRLFDPAPMAPYARLVSYAQGMAALSARFPDDVEARVFHALALAQSAPPTDKTYANQLKAGAILEAEFARQPEHPGLAHYIIHSFDVPALAPRALAAARRYASIAPDAPHALHMPSHTFTRVGAWQESIDTNRASAAAARKDGATAEELHALDYQAYAYLQLAQDAAAKGTVDAVPALAPKIHTSGAGNAAPPAAGFYAAAAIPARYALERDAWAEAATLPITKSPTAWADAVTHFARAIGAARSGQAAAAREDLARLDAITQALQASGDAYWSEQVAIQHLAARAWVLRADGAVDQAVLALREAADREDATEKAAVTPGPLTPAREQLGDMLLGLQRPVDALVAYEATLVKEPGRYRALHGAARAAMAAGRRAQARSHYAALLALAGSATSRPELADARRLVETTPDR
jgi:hypothetical protein